MKTAQATPAIKFTCAYCEVDQYVEDTLAEKNIDGEDVLTAIVDCPSCSHENRVILACPGEEPEEDAETGEDTE